MNQQIASMVADIGIPMLIQQRDEMDAERRQSDEKFQAAVAQIIAMRDVAREALYLVNSEQGANYHGPNEFAFQDDAYCAKVFRAALVAIAKVEV